MTEEEQIVAEVERRRKRAEELGLADLLTLFCDHLEFLKEGLNPERLPNYVTDVKVADIRLGHDLTQIREIFFEEKSYIFALKHNEGIDPGGEPDLTGHLLLIEDGKTLFDLYVLGEDQEWIGRVWKPFRVDAFIEGPWVQKVKTLAQEIFGLSDRRQKQSQAECKKKELENLKKKFGIS